jgi:hypothetical protein
MPVCDGVEAAKRLRSLENRRNVSECLPGVFSRFNGEMHLMTMSQRSRRAKRRLSRVYKNALPQRWNELVPKQAFEEE